MREIKFYKFDPNKNKNTKFLNDVVCFDKITASRSLQYFKRLDSLICEKQVDGKKIRLVCSTVEQINSFFK